MGTNQYIRIRLFSDGAVSAVLMEYGTAEEHEVGKAINLHREQQPREVKGAFTWLRDQLESYQ